MTAKIVSNTPDDAPLMVAYWERVLNGSVYELYFPEELHAAGLRLFDLVAQAGLPDLTSLPESDPSLAGLRQKFEELYDGGLPPPHRPRQTPNTRHRSHD